MCLLHNESNDASSSLYYFLFSLNLTWTRIIWFVMVCVQSGFKVSILVTTIIKPIQTLNAYIIEKLRDFFKRRSHYAEWISKGNNHR